MKKKMLIILLIVVILAILLIFNGIGIAGVFVFQTKYFDTPTEAFWDAPPGTGADVRDDFNSINEIEPIGLVKFDDCNGIFLAITDTNSLLVATMLLKDDKYCVSGNFSLYDTCSTGDYDQKDGFLFTKEFLYTPSKWLPDLRTVKKEAQWCIVFKDCYDIVEKNDLSYEKFSPENYKEFMIVYNNI